MRTRESVSDAKLRGGFYSSDLLVDLCLDRVSELIGAGEHLRALEPAAGDGAFIRGLDRHALGSRIEWCQAVELVSSEAARCAEAVADAQFVGAVANEDVLAWNERSLDRFDLALGNPPFVRYQFLPAASRQRGTVLAAQLGVPGTAVSNLWIPVFLLSLDRLVIGGAFSMILPTEFLTGVSAARVRAWLIANTSDLQIDLFAPDSFPAVLQEVLVLTGRRAEHGRRRKARVTFRDHNGGSHQWEHEVSDDAKTWTGFLLSPAKIDAFNQSSCLPSIRRLGDIARFSVSTVTGANNYFCVTDSTKDAYDLSRWALPLLPRTRYAPGLDFKPEDHAALVSGEQPAWLLSFSAGRETPTSKQNPSRYLADGELRQLHTRYKTRIRDPWYRVPVVPPGDLLMSKRSHRYPRVLLNSAGVVTTDTIYRGSVLPGTGLTGGDVAAAFHNSLTLLSVEICGRSFGGGVLELVPSEISSLAIPIGGTASQQLPNLDAASRVMTNEEELVEATDGFLREWVPEISAPTLQLIQEARLELASRRLQRAHGEFFEE